MAYAICKICKAGLKDHNDVELDRCFKSQQLAEWRKGDAPS